MIFVRNQVGDYTRSLALLLSRVVDGEVLVGGILLGRVDGDPVGCGDIIALAMGHLPVVISERS